MSASALEPAPWSLPRRLLFRFACVYLILYCLPFPLDRLPTSREFFDWPRTAAQYFESMQDLAVAWFGEHLLGVDAAKLKPFMTGSGDTTRAYVTMALHGSIAVLLAGAWSLLTRRTGHPRAADLLRTYVRFVLGATLLGYGTAKFFSGQFPPLADNERWLLTTWGDSSPMGVVWKFMGASPAYTAFSGVVECLGGVLLFWRRTTTLGALLAAAAMLNVALINYCYDVPVKLYSTHLLLMAIGLLLRDVPRLCDVLLWHRDAAPLPLRLPRPLWVAIPEQFAKYALVGWILYGAGAGLQARYERQQLPPGPLEGGYEVAEFVRGGEPVPPLLTDDSRWRYLFLSERYASVRMIDEKTQLGFVPKIDTAAHTLRLERRWSPAMGGTPPEPIELRYRSKDDPQETTAAPEPAEPTSVVEAVEAVARKQEPASPSEADEPTPAAASADLVLEGTMAGAEVRIVLRKLRREDFLVVNRGFHWIQEYPFNR
ncbi:MAG: hypothetical protein H6838_19250 [Planctomycetes bacterium]|nr:hypothetical protein [Planctomycetota bacterium]MCB9887637.1 hypothetical protein [Planctomycetota bacterium]